MIFLKKSPAREVAVFIISIVLLHGSSNCCPLDIDHLHIEDVEDVKAETKRMLCNRTITRASLDILCNNKPFPEYTCRTSMDIDVINLYATVIHGFTMVGVVCEIKQGKQNLVIECNRGEDDPDTDQINCGKSFFPRTKCGVEDEPSSATDPAVLAGGVVGGVVGGVLITVLVVVVWWKCKKRRSANNSTSRGRKESHINLELTQIKGSSTDSSAVPDVIKLSSTKPREDMSQNEYDVIPDNKDGRNLTEREQRSRESEDNVNYSYISDEELDGAGLTRQIPGNDKDTPDTYSRLGAHSTASKEKLNTYNRIGNSGDDSNDKTVSSSDSEPEHVQQTES